MLLWFTECPLGVPGEWTWNRIRHDSWWESVLGVVPVVVIGALYLLLARIGLRRVASASRIQLVGWLSALMVAAFAWLFVVQDAPPEGHRLSKAPWVLYFPSMTGYFHKARFDIKDRTEFLRNYEALMSEGDVLHVGTHPPGLFVMYGVLWDWLRDSPRTVALINATQPESAQEGFDVIAGFAVKQPQGQVTEVDRATLWLATLLTFASVCWVIVPLFGVLRWSESRAMAWKVCCLWPLVPTVAIFMPKDDVLFCGLVMSFVWCWLKSGQSTLENPLAKSVLWGFAAGMLGFAGLCLSLVFLPIGLIAWLVSVLVVFDTQPYRWVVCRRLIAPSCGGVLAILSGLLMVWLMFDLNLLSVWQWNVKNHAAFYSQYPRTTWKWLAVNVIEWVGALGVPIAVLVVASIIRIIRLSQRELSRDGIATYRWASVCGVSLIWGLLWLSGKNSGEAARLWIPLMPLALWLLPAGLESHRSERADDSTEVSNNRLFERALVCQLAASALTVIRVTGFHFGA